MRPVLDVEVHGDKAEYGVHQTTKDKFWEIFLKGVIPLWSKSGYREEIFLITPRGGGEAVQNLYFNFYPQKKY